MAPPAAPAKPAKAAEKATPAAAAPFMQNKPSYLPAPIEEVNESISAVWESIGVWKKLSTTVNSPNIKEHILKVCNMQEMPLIGVDIIPTQQGLKLYVNGEGAKFNRERYLTQQGRRMIERQIHIIPHEKISANPAVDKNQGRIYFEIITTIEDTAQKAKIVDAVASGVIKASEVKDVLEQLKIITKYITHSSFSNQSEKFDQNRQPDVIIKKGTTQCHRRADLEISSQCVIPEDEEPKDAVFLIKDTPGAADVPALSKIDAAKDAAAAGATLPATTLAPQKSAELPPPASTPASEVPAADKDPEKIKALMGEINTIFNEAAVGKADRIKWFTENSYPIRTSEMSVPILEKALAQVKEKYKKAPADGGATLPPPSTAPAAADKPPADPAKQAALKKIFAVREKAGFQDDEILRAWVKTRWSKGLSEMTAPEAGVVADQVVEYSNFLENHKKWGFGSELELLTYVEDSSKKTLHSMVSEEVQKAAKDLGELIS